LLKEKQLLLQIKKGDQNAFKNIFYDYHQSLYRFVLYKIKDEDLADDITQETFLRVWKNRNSLKEDKSFFALIAKISSNLCYDYFRHQEVRNRHKNSVSDFLKHENQDPESINQGETLQTEIFRLINEKLPDKCRNIILLSRIEGKSNQEIAEILSISLRTVENQIYRGIKILKKNLSNFL